MNTQSNAIKGEQKRQEILEMIIQYIEEHGYQPTIREIGDAVGLSSTNSVVSHIHKMIKSGMLETDAEIPGSSRAIRVPGYKFVKEAAHE